MYEQISAFFTIETIYLWLSFGVIPFWLMILLIPSSKFTQILVNSVILPLILSACYIYVVYQIIIVDESIIEIFKCPLCAGSKVPPNIPIFL